MPIKIVRLPNGTKAYQFGITGKKYSINTYGKREAYERSLEQAKAIKFNQNSQEKIIRHRVKVKASPRARGYTRQI